MNPPIYMYNFLHLWQAKTNLYHIIAVILDWGTLVPKMPSTKEKHCWSSTDPVFQQHANTHTNRSSWPTSSFFEISLLEADEVGHFWWVLTEWIKQDAIKVYHYLFSVFSGSHSILGTKTYIRNSFLLKQHKNKFFVMLAILQGKIVQTGTH